MTRRRSLAVLAAVAALALAGCSSSSSEGSGAPAATSTSTTAVAADGGTCAWPWVASKATSNIAYPDTSATYWVSPFDLATGDQLRVEGRFPDARYASFTTYDTKGDPRTVLTDRDFAPVGSAPNPFATDAPSGGRYASAIEASGRGTVIYRVYLGEPKGDRAGGTLPTLVVHRADGTIARLSPCPHPTQNPAAKALVAERGPATDKPAPPSPVFIRPQGDGANLYPNPDNTYVATILHHEVGQVVVVQGKAPTFPDTGAGQPVAGDQQVRYWSLCTNEYRKPYPVTACKADQDVVLGAEGTYTFVISTPEDRPSNATTAEGVNWLPWGPTDVDVLLLLRQMLPQEGWAQAAAAVPSGGLAVSSMGPYAPTGAYCDTTAFERGGAEVCLTSD